MTRARCERRAAAGAALGALVLAGCAVGPDYAAPETVVPAEWSGTADPSAAGAKSVPDAELAPLAQWWTSFEDPVLDSLVARAIRANPDVRMARARVREARARRGLAGAERFPTLDASGSHTRSGISESGFASFESPGGTGDFYQLGFDAAWEIDVFGALRRGVEAADAELAVTVEGRRAVLVSLLAELARTYVDLRGAQQRASIARANLAAQRETLELTRLRLEAGLASELDLARAQAQAETTAAIIPRLEAAARIAIHRLGVLLAEEPAALTSELAADAPIPPLPERVPVGLPSDLLRRRPDVRRAERDLASATARIGIATADLFPRFSLTGSIGVESASSGDLVDSDSRFWSLGQHFRWPIVHFGRLRERIAIASAQEEQAAIAYEQAVLTSLREVEDALVAYGKEQARRETLASAVEASRRAVELAEQLHQQGQTDFLSVLQAQRDLFAAEDALVESESEAARQLVALYKALGGGWEDEALEDDQPEPGEPGERRIDVTAPPAR